MIDFYASSEDVNDSSLADSVAEPTGKKSNSDVSAPVQYDAMTAALDDAMTTRLSDAAATDELVKSCGCPGACSCEREPEGDTTEDPIYGTEPGEGFNNSANTIPGDSANYGDRFGADAANTLSTSYTINPGESFQGTFSSAVDADVVAVNVVAGTTYNFSAVSDSLNFANDVDLQLFNNAGGSLGGDTTGAGAGDGSSFTYTATYTGQVFLQAYSSSGDTGNYLASASEVITATDGSGTNVALPNYGWEQIANYMTNGFWEDTGRSARAYNVSEGGTLTVNINGLEESAKTVALDALKTWGDLLGITFTQSTSSSADMVFDDEVAGRAYAASGPSGTSQNSVFINVDKNWSGGPNPDNFYNYFHQTYIHEIGHALGLGHLGNYNAGSGGSITYPSSVGFAGDMWNASVMSYFSQNSNNTYDASFAYVSTPMMADLVAMEELYGLSTTTRTGNTTYGFGSNAGDMYDFAQYTSGQTPTMTLFDNGGTDTLDASGFSGTQYIDINGGAASSIGGESNNVWVWFDTVIENAVGGSGNDTIVGNDAVNTLRGNGGVDNISGGGNSDFLYGDGGDDTLNGGDGWDWLYGGIGADTNNGGSGTDTVSYLTATSGRVVVDLVSGGSDGDANGDTYSSIERVQGSNFGDTIRGDDGVNTLWGQDGGDFLFGRGGNDVLYGGDGWDWLDGGAGRDGLVGGSGVDTANYENSSEGIIVYLDVRGYDGDAEGDTYNSIERIKGSNFRDDLFGDDAANTFYGLGGADFLHGRVGNDRLEGGDGWDWLDGGVGADILIGGAGIDAADYRLATSGISMTLGGGGFGGEANGDSYSGIERVYGSTHGDQIGGSSANEQFWGSGGIDTFLFTSAGWGSDTIYDFDASAEMIDMRGSGVSQGQISFQTTGSNTTVSFSGISDMITLAGVTSGVNASDFLF